MSETMSIANELSGIIDREDNRNQLAIVRENIDKIRIAVSRKTISIET
jgi:hypothetical protein